VRGYSSWGCVGPRVQEATPRTFSRWRVRCVFTTGELDALREEDVRVLADDGAVYLVTRPSGERETAAEYLAEVCPSIQEPLSLCLSLSLTLTQTLTLT
jgi:hypothetical protein